MIHRKQDGVIALAVAAALATSLTACGDGDASAGSDDGPKIAYFMAARSNTWVSASLDGIEEVAKENGGSVTAFDGKFDPAAQASQIQDALASGQYDAFVVSAIDNTSVVPAIEEAIAQGIPVATTVTTIGPDVHTNEVQIDGQVLAALTAPDRLGELIGQATVQACADLDPCKVAFLIGTPKVSFDKVKQEKFESVIAGSPNIDLVATGEGGYLADPSRQAMQDILQTHPDINVVATIGDQMADGAAQAAADQGADYVVIGQGASEVAVKGIEAGTWFASVIGLPRTEGVLAAKAVIASLNGEEVSPNSVDPVQDAGYTDGLLTKLFLEEHPDFKPEWTG